MISKYIKSWKTTVIGCILIGVGTWLCTIGEDKSVGVPVILAGVGLISARDAE